MINVLLPGTKSAIHRHTNTSEVIGCIYGYAIEHSYDEHGNEAEVRCFKSPITMCEIFNKQLKSTQYIGVSTQIRA